MAKKQASHADYEVIVEDSGKIVVKQSGQIVPNAKGALREIATAVGFALDSKWNTQQAGSKLVDYLKTVSVPSAQVVPEPVAKSIAPKAAVAPNNNNTPKDKDELTPKEMKQLDDILKRLEALEARIAELEKAPASTHSDDSKREVITHHKYVGGDSYTDYYKTSNGRVLDAGYKWLGIIGNSNYLIEFKKILIEIGEEDAIDLKDLTTETLKEAKDKNSACFEQFITQITRLATKYGSKGTLPALLPNDYVLSTDGQLRKTSVTKKAIKF